MKTLYLLMFIPAISFAQMNQSVDRTTASQYYSSFFNPGQNPKQVAQKDIQMWRQSAALTEKFTTEWVQTDSMAVVYDADNRKSEEIFLRYDHAESEWKDNAMMTYTYGLNGEVVNVLHSTGTENGLENTYRQTFTYDPNLNLATSVLQSWNGTNWTDYSRHTYSYSGNLQTSLTIESGGSGTWVAERREVYTYDNSGLLSEINLQNYSGGAWVNDIRYVSTRTTSGNTVVMEDWDINAWVPMSKEENSLAGTQLQMYTFNTWLNGSWEPAYRVGYTYNTSSLNDEQLKENYVNGQWVTERRYTITYNAEGQQVQYTEAEWKDDNWMGVKQIESTYDDNGNLVMQQTGLWDGLQYAGQQRENKYYQSLSVPTGVATMQLEELKVFPNPFHQMVFIQFSSPSEGLAQLEIFNIAGERISYSQFETYEGHNQVAWDPGSDNYGLNEGVYIYSLTMGNEVVRGKLIYEE